MTKKNMIVEAASEMSEEELAAVAGGLYLMTSAIPQDPIHPADPIFPGDPWIPVDPHFPIFRRFLM
jgi:bacteriocin-like protein